MTLDGGRGKVDTLTTGAKVNTLPYWEDITQYRFVMTQSPRGSAYLEETIYGSAKLTLLAAFKHASVFGLLADYTIIIEYESRENKNKGWHRMTGHEVLTQMYKEGVVQA
jgi:hypothetical protein